MNPFEILKAPLLSEKSNELKEKNGSYVFVVNRKATKPEIKKAVELVFSVNVEKVNTCVVRGKFKRRGQYQSLQPATKKAVVKLRSGQTIAHFEDK